MPQHTTSSIVSAVSNGRHAITIEDKRLAKWIKDMKPIPRRDELHRATEHSLVTEVHEGTRFTADGRCTLYVTLHEATIDPNSAAWSLIGMLNWQRGLEAQRLGRRQSSLETRSPAYGPAFV